MESWWFYVGNDAGMITQTAALNSIAIRWLLVCEVAFSQLTKNISIYNMRNEEGNCTAFGLSEDLSLLHIKANISLWQHECFRFAKKTCEYLLWFCTNFYFFCTLEFAPYNAKDGRAQTCRREMFENPFQFIFCALLVSFSQFSSAFSGFLCTKERIYVKSIWCGNLKKQTTRHSHTAENIAKAGRAAISGESPSSSSEQEWHAAPLEKLNNFSTFLFLKFSRKRRKLCTFLDSRTIMLMRKRIECNFIRIYDSLLSRVVSQRHP